MIERYVNKIRSLRLQRQLTQRDLARALHVRQADVSDYETGRRIPPLDVALHIAELFHTNVYDLYFDLVAAVAEEHAVTSCERTNRAP